MKIVAVTNRKGGTGKTSHTVCLAGAFALQGKRVLVVDMDPQASATTWLGHTSQKELLSALMLELPLESVVRKTKIPGIDLVPSSEWLCRLEVLLAGDVSARFCLRESMKSLPKRWDIVLIDCVPSLNLLAIAAMAAADEVIAPVELHSMSVRGVASLAKTISEFREQLNPRLQITAICPFRAQKQTVLYRELMTQLEQVFPGRIFPAIRADVRMGECESFGLPITHHAPTTGAAADYRELASALGQLWFKEEQDVHAA